MAAVPKPCFLHQGRPRHQRRAGQPSPFPTATQAESCLHSSARLSAPGCSQLSPTCPASSQGKANPVLQHGVTRCQAAPGIPPEAQAAPSLVPCPHLTDESGTANRAASYSHGDAALGTRSFAQGGSAGTVPTPTGQR